MAPKKPSPLEVPPAVSSSEEEEEEEVSEEEVEPEEEEDANTEQKQKFPTKKAASSEEDGSESDHPPRGLADPSNVKPVDDASKLKKPRSKPSASPSVVAATPTRSASKRRVENIGGDGKDSKRVKKKVPEAADGDAVETTEKENKPKKPFQRVWSQEDEIVILKGMKDFGTDPIADLDGFSKFIKNSLHIDFTRTQLNDKIRKLKKKYLNNAGRKKKNGADRTFSNCHDQNVFDLSMKMWRSEANNGVGADAPPKKDIEEQNLGPSSQILEESVLLNQTITVGGLDARFIKEGLSLVDTEKKSELEEKWRELHMAEAEFYLRRLDFARKLTEMALDALKKQH